MSYITGEKEKFESNLFCLRDPWFYNSIHDSTVDSNKINIHSIQDDLCVWSLWSACPVGNWINKNGLIWT